MTTIEDLLTSALGRAVKNKGGEDFDFVYNVGLRGNLRRLVGESWLEFFYSLFVSFFFFFFFFSLFFFILFSFHFSFFQSSNLPLFFPLLVPSFRRKIRLWERNKMANKRRFLSFSNRNLSKIL